MGELLKKNGVLVFAVLFCLSLIIPVIHAESPWLDGYARRQLFYWQSDLAAQNVLTVINQTGFNGDNTFYIFNETLPSFEDLAVTLSDGETRLYAWNQTTYIGLNCTFWVNFPVANASYWLYWSNSDAVVGWDQENTFEDVIENLVLALPLDEGSGSTIYDYSGYGNNGVLVNSPEWIDGVYNSALYFNETDSDYAYIADSDELRLSNVIFTIEFWIKTNNTSTRDIVDKATGGGFWLARCQDNGRARCQVYDLSNSISVYSGEGTINNGEWHHVAIPVYNNVSAYVYVDNTPWTDFLMMNYLNAVEPTNTVKIAKGDLSGGYIDMEFDELRIYSANLTSTEISNLYNYYGDVALSDGSVCCRILASSEITEWGTVETAPTTSETEDYWVIGFIFGVIAISMAVAFGVMRKR